MDGGSETVVEPSDTNKDSEGPEKTFKKKAAEPSSFQLSNPSRVTPEQEQCVRFDPQQRYVPVNPHSKPAGIVILVDRMPDEAEDVIQVVVPGSDSEKDEAKPPESFEWNPAMQGL